ncbi:hypothetical protein [Granulosicoccus antarcticus]|uniref:Uncharacterized protein n=1 Tax=Granulosicoccus antarcticus IMCC3135 TaxID=1192854 RepID=A0A2Z2P2C4_9GAMM|nr:hypothetical protein [Granulosicoccus antarcticus]ASJ76448.1 hypothetical protein IMCC3135_32005 [Granulosicoccus antarcticus IMCC3135]
MRNRSAALLKRLQGVEQQRRAVVAQPVALWPQLVNIAEWSAAAQTPQERLKVLERERQKSAS